MKAPQTDLEFRLHKKQGVAFKTRATEVLYGGAAGGGKDLALDTPLPTPTGWTTMGEVRVGDWLIDESGAPCRVVAKSEVLNNPAYRVCFSDGSEIIAGPNHEWVTSDLTERGRVLRQSDSFRARRRALRGSRVSGKKSVKFAKAIGERNARLAAIKPLPHESIRTTLEISKTLRVNERLNHSVRVQGALQLPSAALSIPPYLLGAWLGDGGSRAARITIGEPEMAQLIEAELPPAWRLTKGAGVYDYGIPGGLQVELRALGLLCNKHIPPQYLRASAEQRLALLQGLMDTDGYCDVRGQCEFTNTNKALADGVSELLASLGIKNTICEGVATLSGREISPKYRIKFLTELPAFRLKRKLVKQKRDGFRGTHAQRYIERVEEVGVVPTQCVEVDSPSHMYLCGRQMVPTHNSHLMRIALILWCIQIPGLQCYIFRRISDDLKRNHIEGPKGFRSLLALWEREKAVEIVEDEIRFWNGSKIYLCHCKDEKDRFKYQGAEIHVLAIDELTHFTDVIYRFLRSRVRAIGLPPMPPGMEGMFPRVLCGSNPGGIGHSWVKKTWIECGHAPGETWLTDDDEGGMLRQYIPAKLDDNPSMATDDPTYRARLRGMGSPQLVRAMEHGDWDVIAGAFFPELERRIHEFAPFEIPHNWTRFRAMDWGSAKPFCVGWYAVSDGSLPRFPRGALLKYREWYGSPNHDNTGLRLTAEAVGKGIVEREDGEEIAYGVLDPAAFAEEGGPSLAQRMADVGAYFRRADNTRVGKRGAMVGWDLVRSRLVPDADGLPRLFISSACYDTWRTMVAVQHDEARPEDLDTDSEDHACFVAGTLVRADAGLVPIESARRVWTLHGWKPCHLVETGEREIVRLHMSDGSVIDCTDDHRFLTDCGWVEAKDLLDELRYIIKSEPSWSQSLAARFKSFAASGFTYAASTFSARAGACIERFGRASTAQSRKDITSTIRTATGRTTSRRTLNYSPASIICLCMALMRQSVCALWRIVTGTSRLLGTRARRALSGTRSITSKLKIACTQSVISFVGTAAGPSARVVLGFAATTASPRGAERAGLTMSKGSVRYADLLLWSTSTASSATAHPSAQGRPGLACLRKERMGRQKTYCLTVPDVGNFTLANGAVVHNCDETRYACASRPYENEPEQPKKPRDIWDYSFGDGEPEESWTTV